MTQEDERWEDYHRRSFGPHTRRHHVLRTLHIAGHGDRPMLTRKAFALRVMLPLLFAWLGLVALFVAQLAT